MLWALLSISAGLSDAIYYALLKKFRNLELNTRLLFFNLPVLPFLLLGFLFYDIPKVGSSFYLIIVINLIIWLMAIVLLMKSLEKSDLSLSIPMLSFTPVFLLLTSFVLLKESPNLIGLTGILIVVVGSYILNISSIKYGYLEPLKSMFKNKNVLYMVIVAFLFSISSNLGKIGISLSNPAFFMFTHYLFVLIVLVLLFFRKISHNIQQMKQNFKWIIILGITGASSELLASSAYLFTIVPYVISLKRSSILFSVLFGIVFFKEKNIKEKVIGAALMFTGAVLIILSQ